MKLQTKVDIPDYPFSIDYGDKILFTGSCFAENIGHKISALKYDSILNPHGIIYNPASVSKSLKRIVSGMPYTGEGLTEHKGMWFSYAHHGKFSDTDKSQCLEKINTAQQAAHEQVKEAAYLFITLGTSRVFRLLNGEVVANCHKQAAKLFTREFLSAEQSARQLSQAVEAIRNINPHIRIIFTVSPIRHWKDGAHGNQLSKAALLLAIEKTIHENDRCFYFPVYEIFMDELRDYRFYADDMLHPSAFAVEYIWELFQKAFLKQDQQELRALMIKIRKSREHRILGSNEQATRQFASKGLVLVKKALELEPALNLDEEYSYFTSLSE